MKLLKGIFVFIAIIAGLYALFALSPSIEIALGFFSLSFGLLAIFWTVNAYKCLSPNSSLRRYTALFLLSLIFILANSVWTTLYVIFSFSENLRYVNYILVSIIYIIFVIAAYNILFISKEFGFREQAENIKKALRKKDKSKI